MRIYTHKTYEFSGLVTINGDHIKSGRVGTWILALFLVALAALAVAGLCYCLGYVGPNKEPILLAWVDKFALQNVGADITSIAVAVTSPEEVHGGPCFVSSVVERALFLLGKVGRGRGSVFWYLPDCVES